MWPAAWTRAPVTVAGATQRTDIEHANKNLEIATVDERHRHRISTAAADRDEPTDTRTRHVLIPDMISFELINNWKSPVRHPLADEVLGSSTGCHCDHISEVASSGEQRPGTECTS